MYHSNVIKTYIILLTFVHDTYTRNNNNEGLINVGTVLFTSTDLNKKRWDRANIELLEARRYVQNLIPPPQFVTLSESYLDEILQYFTNTFTTAKRETTDPDTYDVLKNALSDVIAGYLKVWVLPVTKFSYYGGTISEESAVRAFEYYNNLKINLNSDGNGWLDPSDEILNSIAISVVPYIHASHTRSMKNPCEHLAYYEKYNDSMSIATPYINWEDSPTSMFLPLKNESLIMLESLSSSKALIEYYDIAKSCCDTQNPDGCNDFDSRFQDWLVKDVVPHLNDDKLYIAFGSVLSLLKKTKDLFGKVSDSYANDMTILSSCMSPKRFVILLVVLFLEIIWCIPSLLYIFYCRNKRNVKGRTRHFLDIFRRRKIYKYKFHTVGRTDKSENRGNYDPRSLVRIYQPRKIDNGVRLFQKPRAQKMTMDTQCPSDAFEHSSCLETETCFNSIKTANRSITMINEMPLTTSVKKKSVNSLHVQTASLHNKDFSSMIQIESIQKCNTTNVEFNKSFTKITKPPNDDNGSITVRPKMQERVNRNDNVGNDICPCLCCLGDNKKDTKESLNKRKLLKEKPRPNANAIKTNVNIKSKDSRPHKGPNIVKIKEAVEKTVCEPKDIKLNQSKGLKLNTGEPTLEIRIDKPPAEISVDITKCCESSKKAKPSKIPKRAPVNNVVKENKEKVEASNNEQMCVCNPQVFGLVKKRSADNLNDKEKVVKRNIMNVTL